MVHIQKYSFSFTGASALITETLAVAEEYYKLKEGISEIDPGAFFVVTDAYEVFGGE